MELNKQFVDEFYKLFFEVDNNSYIGSKEQARLTLQLKLNRFIPLTYIRKAFDVFIKLNIITVSKSKAYIDKKIGIKYFPMRKQNVYYRNLDVEISEDIFKYLYLGFKDFIEVTGEVASLEDILHLRKLESINEIKIEKLIYDRKDTYNTDFSDVELLYGVSKKKILEYIDILDQYNPNENKSIRENGISNYVDENNCGYNKEIHNMDNRKLKINQLIDNCTDLIKKSLHLYGTLEISLYQNIYYSSELIGTITVTNINLMDNSLYIINDTLNLRFKIEDFYVDKLYSFIGIRDKNIELKLKINDSFKNEVEKQYNLYYEIMRGTCKKKY